MRPLITTVRALKELATGLSPEAVPTSPTLFEFAGNRVDVLLAAEDKRTEVRIIVMRGDNSVERYVPEQLASARRDALSRMASFAERTLVDGPISLPRPWHQYKHNNLVAFFAVPRNDALASRWITEIQVGEYPTVIFWTTTTAEKKVSLEEFEASKPAAPSGWDADWNAAVDAASERFERARRSRPFDVEISLPQLAQSATKGWTYSHWLGTISDDQLSFVEAGTTKSIRLRGPAGSGKTLALILKAIREVLTARESGDDLRVLMVTHSWSLATEISDSIDSMDTELQGEIDVFPLLEIASTISPYYVNDESGFRLIGNDSFSGKQAQLDQIEDVLADFISGDWITYESGVSEALRARFNSPNGDDRLALAWDLLIEFGSVIGAASIFPGAGAESRYIQLPRASWMLPLHLRNDLRVVFALYTRYMDSLDARALQTSDQVLADLLSHLETHAWNRARRTQGYDLIFVDEFHLFSPLERQVLHYLSRDVSVYPRVFMAVDPRQSPSAAFIGIAADETRSSSGGPEEELGDVANFELATVHRFTPQILELITHVHLAFPTFDLGKDWNVSFSDVESARSDGPLPRLIVAESRSGEEDDIAKAVHELYPAGRIALAVVDTRHWPRFSDLAARIGQSKKFHVRTISDRSDVEGVGNRRLGMVVGPAEYLAGLQFDTVLVAGVPDMEANRTPTNEQNRLLSLLYLALSRAQRTVRVFVNEDDGGAADVLRQAVTKGLLKRERGSLV